MTEVPEHLLARSAARRNALEGGGGEAAPAPAAAPSAEVAPAATAAAPAAAATPAAPVVKEPEPVPPYVEAALKRKRIPYWAMSALAFLPLWGILYAQTLSAPPVTEATQLIAGAEVYTGNGCSGCHGPTGGGGSGRPFADCAVVKTFPYIENQLEFVKLGSAGFTGQPYGDPNREGGAHIGGDFGQMPAFGATLTDAELLEVVRHEREVLSGEVVPEDQIDTGSPTEERLWPNGEPMLDSAGVLIDPEGEPLFDDAGKLANPEASISAGGEPAVCE
ncbi:MAG: hypothetical protein KDB33_05585 [Acidimicrobiales bacterium]|nr:hypothetical protein [Acidimicrobiales bacterium]